MKAMIGTWGRSAAVRLPKAWLEALGLKPGDEVELRLEGRSLVVAPRPTLTPLDREALFAKAAAAAGPDPVEWGPDRGVEIVRD